MIFDNFINEALNTGPIKRIGIFPGAFKPPHLGHFETAKRMAKENDLAYIFIGSPDRGSITLLQSLQMWDLYKELLPNNVIIKAAKPSPVKDTYDLVEQLNDSPDAPNTVVTVYAGTQDDFDKRFGSFKTSDKFTNNLAELRSGAIIGIKPTHPRLKQIDPTKLSASALRQVLSDGDTEAFLTAIPDVDQEQVLNIFA